MTFRKNLAHISIILVSLYLASCGGQKSHEGEEHETAEKPQVTPFACQKANNTQIKAVNLGNSKKDEFLKQCAAVTSNSPWCEQLVRPNPESLPIFMCTYGLTQLHQLIHPDTSTWKHAFAAVKLIQELEQKGFRVQQIYNWWRPEPYNKNVGGASGRHPFATSVDVRFFTNEDADRAFLELCNFRKAGRIRAIGHYGTNALHFGMADTRGNTWGRLCP